MSNAATQRVVALVDMDCFYCQVETRLNPNLRGKPLAVVQYNQWKGGGIIAVNYEARALGVTRYMRGDEAKEKCPEIILVSVPTIRGKADLSNYRDAGDEVAEIFSEFSDCVQRASIDEAYIDLTKAVQDYIKNESCTLTEDKLPNTYVVGHCDLENKNEDLRKRGLIEWLKTAEDHKMLDSADYQLAVGGIIVEKMRMKILNRTGFHCSAGIAHNKILAKLTAGLHKPKRQTILPQDSVPELYEKLPVYKVRNLGGKLGKIVTEKLSINYMSELYRFTLGELQQKFDEKTGSWLYNIARGIDLEPVTTRLRPESIGCCKNFPGKNMLTSKSEVEHWLRELATEMSERLVKDLERNKRRAKLLTVSFCQESSMSRCGPLNSYEVTKIVTDALELLKKFNNATANLDLWNPPIRFLGLSAGKFTEELSSIEKYLQNGRNIRNSQIPSTSYGQPGESEKIRDVPSTAAENGENSNDKPATSNSESSFFLEFLKKIKMREEKIAEEKRKVEDENAVEREEMWISLSEVFPDVNEAEPEIIEILPDELQKKLKERLQQPQINENSSAPSVSVEKSVTREICRQCGKSIPVSELAVHSDYHAALKLYSEINRTESVNSMVNRVKVKEPQNQSKRKKKGVVTPTKKMKSITAFFTSVPRQ